MRWMIALIVLLGLSINSPVPARNNECPEKGDCSRCHQTLVEGAHAELSCPDCHGRPPDPGFFTQPSASSCGAVTCLNCHPESAGILQGPMASRKTEKQVVQESFNDIDPHFFDKNCQSCHITGCLDCHGPDGHQISSPGRDDCHSCHRGYFVGADYYGRAPREDALRYQRGPEVDGVNYLKMTPDIHSQVGLKCGDCHTMASLAGGEPVRGCLDCHQPDRRVIEHGIKAHLENMECYACHSAWAPQEYGTFYIRVNGSEKADYFPVKENQGEDYVKSSYLKRQNTPPLGINSRGRISPVRPQFIFYYSDLRPEQGTGKENQELAARWRAFFPHTVRSGTVMCDGCHDKPSRFLLEPEEDRLYLPDKDGMNLKSFWRQEGQEMANGAFLSQERYKKLSRKTPAYIRAYVKRWKKLIEHVEVSSNQ